MTSTVKRQIPGTLAIERFRGVVYGHYERSGRDFPWRHTTDPYHILVSEVMLQQTQTRRVVSKYLEFVERFPNVGALADAKAADVLAAWQGLGYNRRALSLHRIAVRICNDFAGQVPEDKESLLSLPGIGAYTAAAVRVFAFGRPDVFIETNIRTVFIHEFFPTSEAVHDVDLLPLVEASLDHADPRRWYQALMDYGAMLKESCNPSRQSAHHRPQSRFKGSRREARGIILRMLITEGPSDCEILKSHVSEWDSRFDDALTMLQRDGLVVQVGTQLSVAR